MPKPCKTGARLILLCLLVFVSVSIARASTFVMPSDDDLIIGSRAIVRGKVLSISCQLDEQSGRIFTYVRVRVQEVLKGEVGERQIVLKQEGGEVGSRGSTIFGTPQFTKGERVVLYLDTWRDGSLRVYQMFLGKFSIVADPITGEHFAVRDAADRGTSVIQMEGAVGKVTTNRMRLSEYLEMIKRRTAVNLERSREFDSIHYRNTPMRAEPGEYSRTPEGGFRPQYRFLTSPPPRWFEPDDGQPVVFFVNPDGAPSPLILEDVSAAMNAWSGVPGCSLRVVNGGSSPICYSRDSNSIVFNNCDGQFGETPGCASILALGGLNWDSSQTRVVNGTTFVKASAGHISFNPFASCDFDNHCIVREIGTHELGHAVGLGHSQFADATMAGTAHFDGRCASIRQDDIDAITFVYPASGAGPGPLAILTTSPLGIGTTGSAFSRQLLASGGTTPYSWSVISGSLPEGLTLTASGIVSGTPASIGTSDFTVKVTDARGGAAQKALSMNVIAPPSGYDSQFVSQNVAATVRPSQIFFVTVTWLNTGSKPWQGSSGFAIRSQNPAGSVTWGGDTVPWFGSPVNPGEQMELLFQATAPGIPGTYNFQWQLSQTETGLFGEMSANVTIGVGDGSLPAITSPSSVSAMRGIFFTHIPTASGGIPPYSWQQIAGALPAGINLNPNTGALVGTPSVTGSFSVTIQVTDAKSQIAQKTLTISVTEPPFGIVTFTLLPATKGTAFTQQLSAAGGKPPYTWVVSGGALPGGLTLAQSTGIISGTPTASGTFSFTVTAADAQLTSASRSLSIVVAEPAFSITTSSGLPATRGVNFSQQLAATGGKPPYTWAVTGGALPGGLTLAASTGIISGTPAASGTFSFTATATDAQPATASKALTINVAAPPMSVPNVPLLETLMRSSFSYQLIANGGTPPYNWTVTSGALPAGLNLNSSGLISGVSTAAGLFSFVATVRDQGTASSTVSVQIKVIDPETIPSIRKVKYKGHKKLIVIGVRVNPAGVLWVDGSPTSATSDDGYFLIKLKLAAGSHEVKIVNPGGVSSQPVMFTVE